MGWRQTGLGGSALHLVHVRFGGVGMDDVHGVG